MIGDDQPAMRSADAEAEDRRRAAVQQVTERIRHKAKAFSRLFREHPDGAYVLLCLKQEFLPSVLVDKDPNVTQTNAAYRDVIDYIERMSTFEEKQPHVADTEILPERG